MALEVITAEADTGAKGDKVREPAGAEEGWGVRQFR